MNNTFYTKIFVDESKWIELINKNLMNSIYCYQELKPYYLEKRNELLTTNSNAIINQIIEIINNILRKIEEINARYRNNEPYDIKELLPLFLITQMNVKDKEEDNNIKNQVISSLTPSDKENYIELYDDFDEEIKTK